VISHRATLDVPVSIVQKLAAWLSTRRRHTGSRKRRRTLGCYRQAILVLRWFRTDTPIRLLAHDAGIGISTAYRYLHEGIDVLAAHAPDLHEVLERTRREDRSHVNLNSTLMTLVVNSNPVSPHIALEGSRERGGESRHIELRGDTNIRGVTAGPQALLSLRPGRYRMVSRYRAS
jgi:hypothetical protein